MKTRGTPITGTMREQCRELLDESARALTDNFLAANPRRNDPRFGKYEHGMNYLMAMLTRDLER